MKRLYNNHYIEEQRNYRGLQYTILFNIGGYRTAYIDVGDSILKNVDYCSIDLDVHGGLTYGEDHLPFSTESTDRWYIGWDYAHYEDGVDTVTTNKYFGVEKLAASFSFTYFGHCYTLEEVREECREAINQLLEM